MEEYYTPATDEPIARERHQARDLRQSQWWKEKVSKDRTQLAFAPYIVSHVNIVIVLNNNSGCCSFLCFYNLGLYHLYLLY